MIEYETQSIGAGEGAAIVAGLGDELKASARDGIEGSVVGDIVRVGIEDAVGERVGHAIKDRE